jgi:PAS domain-containing protein
MLIGLVGLIGSGKDTVAERLVLEHGFKRDSFAKSLKDAVANIFGWDRLLLEGQTSESRMWRERPDAFWSEKFGRPITPRWVLQHFGTEVMRGNMLDSVWVDSLVARYRGEKTVVSDTRFVNEIRTIKQQGGKIILVRRGDIPTREEMQTKGVHRSEWDWIGSEFDYIIDNTGTIEDLNRSVDDMFDSLIQKH